MTSSIRLGGFKILKGLAQFTLVWKEESKILPNILCQAIAQKKINLSYCTYFHLDGFRGLDLIADTNDGLRLSLLFEEHVGRIYNHAPESAVISIFPHKKNPEIIGKLFNMFHQKMITPAALGNSPSALSVILGKDMVRKARNALFEPFDFSAYRTSEDWKLAQKGDEQLYKEVVATYQEQRPKVYGLEYYEDQECLVIHMERTRVTEMGDAFNHFARMGLYLTSAILEPSLKDDHMILAFSLPSSPRADYVQIIHRLNPKAQIDPIYPVSVFSMNGPHFGDRYGIVSELLNTLNQNDIDLFCLSCTIASITGVVHSDQMNNAIEAIKKCFDVPVVLKKEK
jgi:hypothetical protein